MDIVNLKSSRKAKKRKIHAWLSAFEQREGRPPETSEKEKIHHLYRELKTLEVKLAAASALNDDTVARNNTAEKGAGRNDATRSDASRDGGHSAESTNYRQSSHASAARSTVMPGRSLDVGEPHNVDNSLGTRSIGGTSVSLAEEGLNTRFLGVKTERDRTKEEIKQWLKDFEEREGKPPTNKDKEAIRFLYKQYKTLEGELTQLASQSSPQRALGSQGLPCPLNTIPSDHYGTASTAKSSSELQRTTLHRMSPSSPVLDETQGSVLSDTLRSPAIPSPTEESHQISFAVDAPRGDEKPIASEQAPEKHSSIALEATSPLSAPWPEDDKENERRIDTGYYRANYIHNPPIDHSVQDVGAQDDADARHRTGVMQEGHPAMDSKPDFSSDALLASSSPPRRLVIPHATKFSKDSHSFSSKPSPKGMRASADEDGGDDIRASTANGLDEQRFSDARWADDQPSKNGAIGEEDNTNYSGEGGEIAEQVSERRMGLGSRGLRIGEARDRKDSLCRISSGRSGDHEVNSNSKVEQEAMTANSTVLRGSAVSPLTIEALDGHTEHGKQVALQQAFKALNHLQPSQEMLTDGEPVAGLEIVAADEVNVGGAHSTPERRRQAPLDASTTARSGDLVPLSAQETRVWRMRARFLRMKNILAEEVTDPHSPPGNERPGGISDADAREVGKFNEAGMHGTTMEISARDRWDLLGDVVTPNQPPSFLGRESCSSSPPSRVATERRPAEAHKPDVASNGGPDDGMADETQSAAHVPRSSEPDFAETRSSWLDGQLVNLLQSQVPPPPPPPPPGLEKLQAEVDRLREAVDASTLSFMEEYQDEVRGAELVIASVGVEEVRERERAIELQRLEDAHREMNIYRVREENLVSREDQARERIAALSITLDRRIAAEKQAVVEMAIARERALAPAFARARAGLEAAILAQAGRVREVFGELRTGETVGARKYRVDWTGVPQPVEVRLHCVRAVRDRLARGSYVMLASMAERLGGRTMRWTKKSSFRVGFDEESVNMEEGNAGPCATRPVKHGGRFLDRELRFDQDVYLVCPSKVNLRPSNVMILELFRLGDSSGSRIRGKYCGSHHKKDNVFKEDCSVGWSVLPLADSRLRVIQGSFRIPMVRGNLNPSIDLHETLEKLIANDLENWLGNLYLDVRHLTRIECDDVDVGEVGGSSASHGEGYDFELDYIRKVVRLGKGVSGHIKRSQRIGNQLERFNILRHWRWCGKHNTRTSLEDSEPGLHAVVSSTDMRNDGHTAIDVEAGEGKSGGIETEGKVEGGEREYRSATALRNLSSKDEAAGDHSRPTSEAFNESLSCKVAAESRRNTSIEVIPLSPSAKAPKWTKLRLREAMSMGRKTPAPSPAPDGEKLPTAKVKLERRIWERVVPKRQNYVDVTQGTTSTSGNGPPLDGSWVNLPTDEDNVADAKAKRYQSKVFDEECLSDDDMIRGDKYSFTPVGEAVHAANAAAGTTETSAGRRIGLRRRGEGARWDNTALGTGGRGLTTQHDARSTTRAQSHVWTPLTDPVEMQYYRFAVATDPGIDAPPPPAEVLRRKLRYIKQEVLSDLHPRGWRIVEYWLAVTVFLGALWLRVFIHALGQWLLLHAVGVHVFEFKPRLYEVSIKYVSGSSSLGLEVAYVTWGPMFVILCFTSLVVLAKLWSMVACGGRSGAGGSGSPESVSRFLTAFGVAAALDPYLLFVIDVLAGNNYCTQRCVEYTSPLCRCHEGDAWKLYIRLEAEEGAGITGALITLTIYACTSMATSVVLHQYLLHGHMNGRLIDLWRRLNATEQQFFVPHDFEISAAELHCVSERAKRWRGPRGERREVVVHNLQGEYRNTEGIDPCTSYRAHNGVRGSMGGIGIDGRARDGVIDGVYHRARDLRAPIISTGADSTATPTTRLVEIYEMTADAKRSLHRQFLNTPDGTILEVFGDVGREVDWQLGKVPRAFELGETANGTAGKQRRKALFAGLPPATTVDGDYSFDGADLGRTRFRGEVGVLSTASAKLPGDSMKNG